MICDVCGRNNAEDLTFCQDCGRRLKIREQRVVPPTPPSGMPKVVLPPVPASAPGDGAPASEGRASGKPASSAAPTATPARTTASRLRPEAPVFSFSPSSARQESPTQPVRPELRPARDGGVPSAPPSTESGVPTAPLTAALSLADRIDAPSPMTTALPTLVCGSCEAENPPGYRFCVTCGAPLNKKTLPAPPMGNASKASAAPEPRVPPKVPDATSRPAPLPPPPMSRPDKPSGAEAQRPALAVPPPAIPGSPPLPPIAPPPRTGAAPPNAAGADKIVGSPVVDIAGARQAPVRLIECARCHGQCAAGTRFCKYCGAPLEAVDRASQPRAAGGDRGAAPQIDPPLDRSGEPDRAPPPEGERAKSPPPAAGDRAGQGDVATLASSVETAGAPVRPSQIPLAPLRASYSVRPIAWVASDVRSTRAPGGKLVVIVEDGSEGKSFPLTGQQIDIGRSDGDILLEDDQYVSPRHARLTPQDGGWLLRDLGSVNRIYLRIRKAHALRDGDLLLLGLEVLQFQTVSDGERGLGHAVQHGTLLFGSPAIQRRARLCQKTVEGVTRDVYHLYRDETVIGRETGDIVFTADPFLSRRHAAIRRNPAAGDFTLTDLESSNGTYVAIREDVTLTNGDFVRIGQHLFRVDLS